MLQVKKNEGTHIKQQASGLMNTNMAEQRFGHNLVNPKTCMRPVGVTPVV